MNVADREEIDRLKEELEASGVDKSSRIRGHRALVLSAEAANGCKTPDERMQKIAEGVHGLAVFMVGFVASAPQFTEEAARKAAEEAAKKAVESCPYNQDHQKAIAKASQQLDASTKPWVQVAKIAFLKSPVALAIVIVALIVAGFGKVILSAFGIS